MTALGWIGLITYALGLAAILFLPERIESAKTAMEWGFTMAAFDSMTTRLK